MYIILFNFLGSCLYAYFFLGSLNFEEINATTIDVANYINVDTLIAIRLINEGQDNDLQRIWNNISTGSNIVLYQMLGELNILDNVPLSIFINTLLVYLSIPRSGFKNYLILCPYLVMASIGFNKEIFLIFAFSVYYNYLNNKKILDILNSGFIIFISRIYFIIIIIINYVFVKLNFSYKFLLIGYLIVSLLIGYFSSSFENHQYFININSNNSLSYVILNYFNLTIFNELLYPLINLIKLIYEPLSYLFFPANLYSFLQGYLFLVYIYFLRSNFKYTNLIFKLMIVYYLFISFMPIVHFRYLIPIIVLFVLNSKIK